MTAFPAPLPERTGGPAHYEIRVQGHLPPRWSAWFEELSVTDEADGTTALRGPVIDQAALHGVLSKVRDTGLALVSVTRLDADPSRPSDSPVPGRNPR